MVLKHCSPESLAQGRFSTFLSSNLQQLPQSISKFFCPRPSCKAFKFKELLTAQNKAKQIRVTLHRGHLKIWIVAIFDFFSFF